MCVLWNTIYRQLSEFVWFLLKPWKELFTNIAKKEDLLSATVMGSLLSCQYLTFTCTLWSMRFAHVDPGTELSLTFGYMYLFCWVAESYFGRMFVHIIALMIGMTGCFLSLLKHIVSDADRKIKFESFLLRALLSSLPLQSAAVLTEKHFLQKIISLDNFLFLVMWTGLIGTFAISVVIELFIEYPSLRLGLAISVSVSTFYQLVIVLMRYQFFQKSRFYYNIHYSVSKVMINFLTTKIKGVELDHVPERRTVKIAAVKIIRMMPFVVSLFMFAISIQGALFLLDYQTTFTITSDWMPNIKLVTLTTFVSVAVLPIMYLYVFPTFHRFKLLKTDLQKVGLCFMMLILCLICCSLVHYFLKSRIKPFPPHNHTQVNIVNGFDSPLHIVTSVENATVHPHHVYTITNKFENNTNRWLIDTYNNENNYHKQGDLTSMCKSAILCVASKLGLNCKGIFSTASMNMYMIPPRSSTVCLVNILSSVVVVVLTDLENYQNISFIVSPNQIIDRNIAAKYYNVAIISNNEKATVMKNVSFGEISAMAIYIYNENQQTNFRLLTLANKKVLPDFYIFPSLFFFGTSDAIAILYMFKFCYEQSPQKLLATMGTFAYTLEFGPKMIYSLTGMIEFDSAMIFFLLLSHISFSVLHIFITIKIDLYKELDKALRCSIALGKYVPVSSSMNFTESTPSIKGIQSDEEQKTVDQN